MGKYIDSDWQNWMGGDPLGKSGKNLGLYRVNWGQIDVFVAKQGSSWVIGWSL